MGLLLLLSLLRRLALRLLRRLTLLLLRLLPMLLLPAAGFVKAFWLPAFPVWIFWLLAMVYPLFLLWRNHTSRQVVMAAKKL